jgi:hypothetical protein
LFYSNIEIFVSFGFEKFCFEFFVGKNSWDVFFRLIFVRIGCFWKRRFLVFCGEELLNYFCFIEIWKYWCVFCLKNCVLVFCGEWWLTGFCFYRFEVGEMNICVVL